jgi:hypothetical protein
MSHQHILSTLLDILWTGYKKRVDYAAQYERMVLERGGRVRNDHLAFRTFNCTTGAQPPGVEGIARIFTALGYERKDGYVFPDKRLTAWHWEHKTDPRNPKIFISQLEVDELPEAIAKLIEESVGAAPDLLATGDRHALRDLAAGKDIPEADAATLGERFATFFTRPWDAPHRRFVEEVDKTSQYAAWTLLHGNAVNHFTAYINEQNVKEWPDIEATVAALRAAGLPMKDEFEGERGSKLRQSSTKAATVDCDVIEEGGRMGKIHWSYAYYELAERGNVPDVNGQPQRFQGFLGAQATNLFEMTRRH